MIWAWVVVAAGALLGGVALWVYRRKRLLRLVSAAGDLARAETDLEYRERTDEERETRHEADSVDTVRQHEKILLKQAQTNTQVSHGERIDLVDRINRGGI